MLRPPEVTLLEKYGLLTPPVGTLTPEAIDAAVVAAAEYGPRAEAHCPHVRPLLDRMLGLFRAGWQPVVPKPPEAVLLTKRNPFQWE